MKKLLCAFAVLSLILAGCGNEPDESSVLLPDVGEAYADNTDEVSDSGKKKRPTIRKLPRILIRVPQVPICRTAAMPIPMIKTSAGFLVRAALYQIMAIRAILVLTNQSRRQQPKARLIPRRKPKSRRNYTILRESSMKSATEVC